jgi:hypothetical protein
MTIGGYSLGFLGFRAQADLALQLSEVAADPNLTIRSRSRMIVLVSPRALPSQKELYSLSVTEKIVTASLL